MRGMTTGDPDVPDVLTAQQAAEILLLSPHHVRRLAKEGKLPATRIGGSWRFSRAALAAMFVPAGGQ